MYHPKTQVHTQLSGTQIPREKKQTWMSNHICLTSQEPDIASSLYLTHPVCQALPGWAMPHPTCNHQDLPLEGVPDPEFSFHIEVEWIASCCQRFQGEPKRHLVCALLPRKEQKVPFPSCCCSTCLQKAGWENRPPSCRKQLRVLKQMRNCLNLD